MAEKLEIWLPIVTGLFGAIVAFLSLIIPYIKNVKAKKILEETKNILETSIKIADAVKPYMFEVEKFEHYTQEEKKMAVMVKANQYAIENKLDFNKEQVSKEIEKNIEVSKKLNQREKDKHGELNVVVEEKKI